MIHDLEIILHLVRSPVQTIDAVGVPVLSRGEELARQLVPRLLVGLETRLALLHVAAGAHGELARVVLRLADRLGDLVVGVVEHLAQQEHRALHRREAFEQHEEGHRHRVGHLGVLRGVGCLVGEQRLGQPWPDVTLAPHAC